MMESGDATMNNFWQDSWCTNSNMATLQEIIDISLIDTSFLVLNFILDTK